MESKEKPLFEIDDDAWWVSRLATAILLLIALLFMISAADFNFAIIRNQLFAQSVIAFSVIYLITIVFEVKKAISAKENVIQFYEDKVIRTFDNRVLETQKINETYRLKNFFVYKSKPQRLTLLLKTYIFVTFPITFIVYPLIAVSSVILTKIYYAVKYKCVKADDGLQTLLLIDENNNFFPLILGCQNEYEKIQHYLKEHLDIELPQVEQRFLYLPEKSIIAGGTNG